MHNDRYPENIVAKSAERYRLAGRHIVSMLERRLEIEMPEPTSSTLESMMVVACYTDNALDTALGHDRGEYERIFNESADFLFASERAYTLPNNYAACAPDAWEVRGYLDNHDPEGRAALQKDFNLYHQLGIELHDARQSKLYAALTRIEGRVAMRCLLDLLPSNIRRRPSHQQTFDWFLKLGQLGNAYDSLADSTTDVRAGRAHAGSPLQLKLSLARAALSDIGPVLRHLTMQEWLKEAKDFTGVIRGTTK